MLNGTLLLIRLLSTLIVAVLGLGGGLYLLAWGIEVPVAYWAICATAIVGVVGKEAVEAVVKAKAAKETMQ